MNNRVGYDIDIGEQRIEVKAGCVSIMNGRPILKWNNVRPSDPYTHILFIAFYPDDARMFLVPRDLIPPAALKAQFTGANGHIFQVHTRNVYDPPSWMAVCEIQM